MQISVAPPSALEHRKAMSAMSVTIRNQLIQVPTSRPVAGNKQLGQTGGSYLCDLLLHFAYFHYTAAMCAAAARSSVTLTNRDSKTLLH